MKYKTIKTRIKTVENQFRMEKAYIQSKNKYIPVLIPLRF